VSVVNDSPGSIYRSDCFVLARLDARGWRQVVSSHGVNISCPISGGEVQDPHSHQPVGLVLFDDLHLGTYRITLYYRLVPRHPKVLKALTRRDRVARLQFTIGSAPVQPKPQLPEKRIVSLAMASAKRGGDSRPSLIEHAAGTRFNAVRVGQGDLVFEWNWSYLIAVVVTSATATWVRRDPRQRSMAR
jgi:hypothetical protein